MALIYRNEYKIFHMISKLLGTSLLILVSILVCFTASGQVQLGSSLHGRSEYDGMGESVALNHAGDIMAVGIPNDYYTPYAFGRVAVYQFDGNDWELMGNEISGTTYRGGFGHLVSINSAGNIIAVSERRFDYSSENIIYSYKFNGVDWVQLGQPVFSDVEGDMFGVSLDLNDSGNVMAIGSFSRANSNQPGYVQVYKFEDNSWHLLGSRIIGMVNRDSFGIAVSLNAAGNILAIGCRHANFVSIIGYTQVYQIVENEWEKMGETIYGESASENFGNSVSLNSAGNTLAISATPPYNRGINNLKIRIFEFIDSKWIPKGSQIKSMKPCNMLLVKGVY